MRTSIDFVARDLYDIINIERKVLFIKIIFINSTKSQFRKYIYIIIECVFQSCFRSSPMTVKFHNKDYADNAGGNYKDRKTIRLGHVNDSSVFIIALFLYVIFVLKFHDH